MSDKQNKRFLTYEEQIELLKNKKLHIDNEDDAVSYLKQYGYYSLISGYKDIFKIEKNGNYKSDATFNKIVSLYIFDEYLRHLVLHEIIKIEKHIKSLYSYSFCLLYGDKQDDYLNVTNYNYSKYQKEINDFVSIVQNLLRSPEKYNYVNYNITKYGTVPLWVIIQTLTFGNLSKMYMFSNQSLQSQIARNFENVYSNQLDSMLNVLSKFRNVCAHGERLFNYKTKKSIQNLPIHKNLKDYSPASKNNLFNVIICFKYLLSKNDFLYFFDNLENMIKFLIDTVGSKYSEMVLDKMGFPNNWKDIKTIEL